MLKNFIIATLLFSGLSLNAQVLQPISTIQTPKSASNDTSSIYGQVVKVKGVVVTEPDTWYQSPFAPVNSTSNALSFWIQDSNGVGPKTGLQVRLGKAGTHAGNTGVAALDPGMMIELQGKVDYFTGETQINLDTTVQITVLNAGIANTKSPVNISDLNNSSGVAVSTGEQWQGTYATISNATVISVNSSSIRGNFTVRDVAGNQIIIWDGNYNMRMSLNGFTKPAVGSVFTSISGIIYHRGPFPPATGPGAFELHPTMPSDLVLGAAPAVVNSLTRNPACPNPSGSVTVTANVSHPANEAITGGKLFYAVGASTTNYIQVTMTESTSGVWTASIPAQADGSFVHYYVEITDATGDVTKNPSFAPYNYKVNSNGCTISDIQYTAQQIQVGASQWYESGYKNLAVTGVKGIVTATTNDLGYVYFHFQILQNLKYSLLL